MRLSTTSTRNAFTILIGEMTPLAGVDLDHEIAAPWQRPRLLRAGPVIQQRRFAVCLRPHERSHANGVLTRRRLGEHDFRAIDLNLLDRNQSVLYENS